MNIKSKNTQKSLKALEKITGAKLTLGGVIRAIRQADGKSQVDFAALLKIPKQQLCDIECGRKSVSPKLAAIYADRLGYSREQFIRLSLQDMMERQGLGFKIVIIPMHPKKKFNEVNYE